jgi:hypothetical protein
MRHALWLFEIDELMDKIFTVGSVGHKAFAACVNMPRLKNI